MKFFKYHALGNDYLVLRTADGADELNADQIIRLCHRHLGIGADGIMVQLPQDSTSRFPVRIFNPDGSEVEHSGNGIRIFARCLWDQVLVGDAPFTVITERGDVECQVSQGGLEVSVRLGEVSFRSEDVPITGPTREVLMEPLQLDGREVIHSAVSMGNPHSVVVEEKVNKELILAVGSQIENHDSFPRKANVLCMEILNRERIRIEIWERGVGYTLASGTSAAAAAAVGKRLGLCESETIVQMSGGDLAVLVDDHYQVRITGQVTRVAEGELYEELFHWRS